MNYEEKYKEALKKVKELLKDQEMALHAREKLANVFPELKESEGERMRKNLYKCLRYYVPEDIAEEYITWLEKQKDVSSVEHVFRPIVGCDITCAATQAIEQQQLGYKVVLAFNGAYIPVGEKTADDIVNEYYSWLEKQGETFTKKDVDNAYLKGICDTKHEFEKKGDVNETINRDELAQGVLKGAAINLITWIDYNAAEGNMCLSNMECKDIEDALVSGNWDKIYAYIKKKLEKQGELNPYSGISFKYNGHTFGMCARDNGVEILVDGEIKERVFLDNNLKL